MLVAILKVLLKRQGQCSLFVAVITASEWDRSEKVITEFAVTKAHFVKASSRSLLPIDGNCVSNIIFMDK
jgi:hypothetical protein